jgi:hypothetical protein
MKDARHYAHKNPGLTLAVVTWAKQQSWPENLAAVVRVRLDDPNGHDFHRDDAGVWHPPEDPAARKTAQTAAKRKAMIDRAKQQASNEARAAAQDKANRERQERDWQTLSQQQRDDILRHVRTAHRSLAGKPDENPALLSFCWAEMDLRAATCQRRTK